MNALTTLDSLSLDALTKAAKESFAECSQVFTLIERKWNHLEHFGRILSAAKKKVPYGEWEQWIMTTFQGKLPSRTARQWISDVERPELADLRREKDREKQKSLRQDPAEVDAVQEASVEVLETPQKLRKTGKATVQPDDDTSSPAKQETTVSAADQAKLNRKLAQALIDKAVRAVDDLNHVKPNPSVRDKVVKMLQNAEGLLW